MSYIFIDIILCLFLYGILFMIIMKKKWSQNKRDDSNDDDEGGILNWTPPELDLPPGVTLPVGPSVILKEEEVVLDH